MRFIFDQRLGTRSTLIGLENKPQKKKGKIREKRFGKLGKEEEKIARIIEKSGGWLDLKRIVWFTLPFQLVLYFILVLFILNILSRSRMKFLLIM